VGIQDKEKEFTVVSTDESFFFYDYLVRRVWIDAGKRPIVHTTGSHKHSHVCLEPSVWTVNSSSQTT
jgi:hypothetical protein